MGPKCKRTIARKPKRSIHRQVKEEQPTQMLLYKQFFKTDDECIGIVNENAELRGNDWSDDRHDDESASQLVELLHCR